jgi:hypothetical protein
MTRTQRIADEINHRAARGPTMALCDPDPGWRDVAKFAAGVVIGAAFGFLMRGAM